VRVPGDGRVIGMPLPAAPAHRPWGLNASYLAEVVSVRDPDALGRVQVRLLGWDGPEDQDAPVWARVAVPFAGNGRGALLIPDVGDEVLVTFVNADPRMPVVVGGLWSGSASPPEQFAGDRVDRWTFTGKQGTRIAMVEEASGATIAFETPNGIKGTLTEQSGGKIELSVMDATVITLESSKVTLRTGGTVNVEASQVDVSAGMVKVDAAMSTFSGIVKCDVLQTNTVISSTYTPGAGNVW
jgi:uncharacterized protein involved in type VI secretion and phage assembly